MSDSGRETTLDTLFAGALTCLQYRDGYRFNQDSVILAHFVQPAPGERILDLGSGCGVIGLILAYRRPEVRIVGLEIQADLVALSRRNAQDNGFAGRFEVVEGDLNGADVLAGALFDRIVGNPPYMDPQKSRGSRNQERFLARQGLQAGPENLARAAARLLVDGGKLDLVYPANRLPSLASALKKHDLIPAKLRPVRGFPGATEMLVLLEAIKKGDGVLKTLPPFFIYNEKGGEYSPEMKSCYAPERGKPHSEQPGDSIIP
ncbi:MAG: methyltransferase [Proteobacteria bacterium]|nr:methyltransferase [Pseudomonadota bacterium]MBU1738124.1 methyltransferase [Pseudomonadota bacterium]